MSVAMTMEAPAARAAPEAPVLELRELTRVFHLGKRFLREGKPLRAVDGVSLSIRRGEALAIVGESGCGKTTLSRLMLGLQPPTSGEVRVSGELLSGIDRKAFARRVQPVFQDPYSSLNPRKTIGEIIADPLHIHGVGARADRLREAEAMMERVGLARRLVHSYPSQLSGGQRQRVAIARALIMRPEIIICDEPTSALDVSVQAQILNLLQELREAFNLTYVFISHDLSVVEYMADQVAVMYMGRIVEHGPAASVLGAPRHPYTRALLDSVLTPEPGLGLPRMAIGRGFPDPLDPPPGCRFHPRCPAAMPVCKTTAPVRVEDAAGAVECHLVGA